MNYLICFILGIFGGVMLSGYALEVDGLCQAENEKLIYECEIAPNFSCKIIAVPN